MEGKQSAMSTVIGPPAPGGRRAPGGFLAGVGRPGGPTGADGSSGADGSLTPSALGGGRAIPPNPPRLSPRKLPPRFPGSGRRAWGSGGPPPLSRARSPVASPGPVGPETATAARPGGVLAQPVGIRRPPWPQGGRRPSQRRRECSTCV